MESYELMKPVFTRIAVEEGGHYQFRDEKYWGGDMSVIPITYHKLVVPIKDAHVIVDYELGNHNMASFFCELSDFNPIPSFTISYRSPYRRLFNKKLNALKVNCEDTHFKNYLQQELIELELEHIARDSQFEPNIKLIHSDTSAELKTRYYLGFKYKHRVIQPLLRFYEAVIEWGR